MASRVNTKFVAILVTSLVLVGGGVAATAFFILFKSASQLHDLAVSKLTSGDLVNADKFMSKAVAKERTNSGYMREWIEIMKKLELKSQTEFENKYRTNFVPAQRQLAVLLRTDVQAHKDYLEQVWEQMSAGGLTRRAADEMVKQTNDALRFFDKQPAGPWETLKRYRGMAMTRAMLDQAEMKDEERKAALADLEAALKADPKDAEVAVAIENWHFAESLSLRAKGQEDEAKATAAAGREAVETYLAANPGDPRLMLVKLRWLLNDAQKAVGDSLTAEAKKSAFKRANEAAVPRLDEVAEVIKAAPLEKAGLDVVSTLKSYEMMLDPGASNRRALEVLQAQSAAHPEDADLLYALGRTYHDRNEFEKAIETYEKMIAIPQKPLGLPGLRQFTLRAEGAFRQTLAAVALYDRANADDKEKKAALLAKAREYRANLVKYEPEDSARGRLATAQVKFRDNDVTGAQALMTAYETANKEPDADALWLSAQIALALNQPGIARTKLETLLQVNGNDAKAVFMLASVEARLQNFDKAQKLAEALLEADPKNELTLKLLDEIKMQRGDVGAGDEITRLLNAAQAKADAGDTAAMFKMMEDGFAKNPKDQRLAYALVLQKYRAKDYAGAIKTAEAALAADPNNPQFKQLLIIAKNPDPVAGTEDAIRASDIPEFDKVMALIDLYRQNQQPNDDKVRALIEQATKLKPDEPRVLEYRFIAAVTTQNFEEGRKITELASSKNLDNIGGASFRSRLMDAEGDALRKQGKATEADAKLNDAITTLQQASGQAGFGLEAWRMLGNLQFRGQRFTDAINSYKRGLAIRPNDTAMIEEYLAALVNVPGETMMDEALQFARESEKYARGSARFRNMLLNLEARYGDATKAITERKKMLTTAPDNRDNKVALAALYIDEKDFVEARKVIDLVRAEKDDLESVQLDARYYASTGDTAKAEQVLREFAAKLDPAKSETDRTTKTQALLSLMRSALSSGDVAKAESIIAEVRTFQDPKTLPADRTLGDMYMSMERFPQAIEALARVVDGKADDADFTYTKRLIESCIRGGKPDDAQARIKAMGSYGDTNPIVQLLMADSVQAAASAARSKGDEAKAKSFEAQAASILDKAVTTFPGSAEVYMKRAMFTLTRNGPINDALADATKSLQIRPGYPQALRLRAQINAKAGREEEAIKDLREALRTDVFADDLRAQLMLRLIADDRSAEAAELATEALTRRQNDVQLMLSFATLFANRGDTQRATPFVEMAVKRSDQTFVALQALDFYLNVMPVNNAASLEKAEAILERQKDKIATDSALLLARSQVLGRRAKSLESRRDAAASFKMIDDKERGKILNWFGQLRRVMKPADLSLLFDGLEREKVKVEWIKYFRSQQLMLAKETEKQGVDILNELMKASDEGVRLQAFRTLAPFQYTRGEYQKAADVWVEGLKEFPNDWEMRNNLAFTFAKFLGKPTEGAEQSKQAAKILEQSGQTNADVYDTLGYCLSQTGDYAGAKAAFDTAMQQAASFATAVTVLTHETEMNIKAGNLDAGKKSYARAVDFLAKVKPSNETSPDQIKQLRDDLEALKAPLGL